MLFDGGGVMMGLADLETAARYGMGLLVVCHEDGGFTSGRVVLARNNRGTSLGDHINPDLAATAENLGYQVFTATCDIEIS